MTQVNRISSFLDGVSDDAIFGWIANLDHPQTLEHVLVHDQHDRIAQFHACLPRRDVCDALAIDGRFGFAIPLSALHGFGSVVRLTDRNGHVIQHGNAVPLARGPRAIPRMQDPAWAVVHIPKTAGTSLRVALDGIVRRGESIYVYEDGFTGVSHAELSRMPLGQRAALRLAFGHLHMDGFSVLPRPLEYITVLRDSAARLRSHYYHHVLAGAPLPGPDGPVDVVTAINEGLVDDFDNMMVRMIISQTASTLPSGKVSEVHVTAAFRLLSTRYRFVATAERLAAEFPALCRALGVKERLLPRENLRVLPLTPGHEAAVDWPRVLHRNRFDAMLYRRAIDEGLCGRDLMPPGHRAPAPFPR